MGPTCLRPSVPLLCAGVGVAALAAKLPEAASASTASPATAVRRLRRTRANEYMGVPKVLCGTAATTPKGACPLHLMDWWLRLGLSRCPRGDEGRYWDGLRNS